MSTAIESDALWLDRVWLAECSRCANEATSFEIEMRDARADLAAAGWTARDDESQFCPACTASVTPAGSGAQE